MVGTITGKTKRESQRKVKRHSLAGTKKKRRELVLLVIESYLTHGPSNILAWSLTLKCMNK
jgi:hypothetical protein